jgi:hypothetical protein
MGMHRDGCRENRRELPVKLRAGLHCIDVKLNAKALTQLV